MRSPLLARPSRSSARRLALVAVAAATSVLVAVAPAHAEGDVVGAFAPPPMAPFKRGPMVEGSAGVYAPRGRLGRISDPGPWLRLSVGWDFTRWLSVFGVADAAFLATNKASPPPGERGYTVWGFGAGARVSIGVTDRVRIPVRAELGMHKASDDGVLGAYSFPNAQDFGVSFGATAGIEWRAASRHFGLVLEGGVRNDAALSYVGKPESPLAIVGALGIHYTL